MNPTSPLTRLFGRSPIGPLQAHMDKVAECVAELPAFIDAVLEGDREQVVEHQRRIAAIENEADDLKHDLRLHLPRSLFMPVDRRDLLEVLAMQDKIANRVKDIAGLMLGREMQLPQSIQQNYLALVHRCVDACTQAHRLISELSALVETGFSGGEIETMMEMVHQLDRVEKDTDQRQVELYGQLLALEPELSPIDVVFLYRLVDWTSDVADRAQRVGSRLQLILAK